MFFCKYFMSFWVIFSCFNFIKLNHVVSQLFNYVICFIFILKKTYTKGGQRGTTTTEKMVIIFLLFLLLLLLLKRSVRKAQKSVEMFVIL